MTGGSKGEGARGTGAPPPAGGEKPKRRLVVFADGTGAAFSLRESNIWRLYQALGYANGEQKAFYIPGVGTSPVPVWRELDGATGLGVPDNVRTAYRFLCENWRAGDEIFLFGFSRGAFTVRALAGMIFHVGLMPVADPLGVPLTRAEISANVRGAWRDYRRKTTTGAESVSIRGIRTLRDMAVDMARKARGLRPHAEIARERDDRFPERRVVPIRFMGLFDTVEAFGVPIEELRGIIDKWIWPISFRNRVLSRRVETARHALALDDDRRTFHPVRIDLGGDQKARDIKEVWFAGAHSDVGGGYPDDRASHAPLTWIADEAAKAGLDLDPEERKHWANRAAGRGPLHDGRAGLAAFYRYAPRDMSGPPPVVHASVEARIAGGAERYAPITLVGVPLVWSGGTAPSTHAADVAEDVKDSVLGRKLSLAAIFALAGAVLAAPWWMAQLGLADMDYVGANQVLGPIGDAAISVSPGWAQPWLRQFAETPFVMTALLALLAAAFVDHRRRRPAIMEDAHRRWVGEALAAGRGSLFRRWMRWHGGGPAQSAPALDAMQVPMNPPRSPLLNRMRKSPWMCALVRFFGRRFAPWAIAAAALVAALIGLDRMALGVMAGVGGFCTTAAATWEPVGPEGFQPLVVVDPQSRCVPTGATVEKGATYRVTVRVGAPLKDAALAATPAGLVDDGGWAMTLATPLRRMWSADWMQLIAQIGESGRAEQPLALELVDPADAADATGAGAEFAATFTAERAGPLYFYVNDAWVPLPAAWQPFYSNNCGMMSVDVVLQSRR